MNNKIIGFNEEGYEQYKRIAMEVTRRIMNDQPHRQRWKNPATREFCVILDASLAAAANSKTAATSCLATICTWDATESIFTESEDQITVWNHSESTSHEVDTFGTARWIGGHWWFFGDCEAMGDRDET